MTYSGDIGDMVLNAADNSFVAALFILAAFSYLCYKRGFGVVTTMFVVYPVVVGLITSDWLPKAVQGFGLLAIGTLWGLALLRIFGGVATTDFQKIYIISLCISGALLLSGFTVANATGTNLNLANQVSHPDMTGVNISSSNPAVSITRSLTIVYTFLGPSISFFMGGSIYALMLSVGVDPIYSNVVMVPILAISVLALVQWLLTVLLPVLATLAAATAAAISKIIPGR
jgi:hypothetical protein